MAKRDQARRKRRDGLKHATSLIRDVCELAGMTSLIDDARVWLAAAGVIDAIKHRSDPALFNWLLECINYQGISNSAAATYIERHGNVGYFDVARSLDATPACPKLQSYWQFNGCGYRKTARCCNEPGRFKACPLPKQDMRNGSLNQAAYSLFLFMRDIAGGDLVGWIDRRLEDADRPGSRRRSHQLGQAVLEPLRNVHGVSDKVLSMTLASLLLVGDPGRERWVTAGTGLIAVDTLIHNWFVRAGILERLDAVHPYGPRCDDETGCAAIIGHVARRIDASRFNPEFPKVFPRFVQHAIWGFCSQAGLNQCNGNTVRDGTRCDDTVCPLFEDCDRVVVTKPVAT
jgi:hypothetical protein